MTTDIREMEECVNGVDLMKQRIRALDKQVADAARTLATALYNRDWELVNHVRWSLDPMGGGAIDVEASR